MGNFFKSLLFIIITTFGLFNFNNKINAVAGEQYFIVTAYYSPLPNQKHYTTGSYWGDKKLNGEGHTTASGKGVYTGILAAPTKYPFGTKIYFEGLGIGAVEDRGGAIVKAGQRGYEHDRIDIWMGYGDEGLMRAKKWGKRVVKGKVVSSESNVNMKFKDNIFIGLDKITVNPTIHSKKSVKILQANLRNVGLYKGLIDGKYESIKETLVNFQLKNKLISSKNDEAAGHFGNKTYVALLKKYCPNNPLLAQHNTKIIETSKEVVTILNAPEIKLNGDNSVKSEVKKVQELFSKLGLYNGKIDGNFNSIKNPLLSFQKQAGIIKNEKSWGAGYFGEKTKAALISYFEDEATRRKELNIVKLSSRDYITLNKIVYKLDNSVKKSSKNKKIEKKLKNDIISKIEKVKRKTRDNLQKLKLEYIIDKLEET